MSSDEAPGVSPTDPCRRARCPAVIQKAFHVPMQVCGRRPVLARLERREVRGSPWVMPVEPPPGDMGDAGEVEGACEMEPTLRAERRLGRLFRPA